MAMVAPAQSETFQYIYDDTAQLSKAIDSTGTVIEYVYDDVGNILEIKRSTVDPNGLETFGFVPQQGEVGTEVTIQGQNFSTTPANNTVQFNGTAATVTLATTNVLEVIVPLGATTGPISVTVGGATSTTQNIFTVIAAPTILSIDPTIVLGDSTLSNFTVTGTNFTGATFSFTPEFVPPVLTLGAPAINGAGTSATFPILLDANATGTFTLIVTNALGSSSAFDTGVNSLRVLSPTLDADADGLTNADEFALGTDPLIPDTDGDGIPDGDEVRLGLNPNDPVDAGQDADGDGLTNLEEFLAGTDPFNSDTVPPAVAQVEPVDGVIDFSINKRVIIRFNEPVQNFFFPGTIQLFQGAFEVTGNLVLSNDGLSVTFTPDGNLLPLAIHTISVQGVRDLAGNILVGTFESSFTTEEFSDFVPPTFLRTSPQNVSLNVPINTPIRVQFSEIMDSATLTPENFFVQDNTTGLKVPGMIQVDADGLTASFVPDSVYTVGRVHAVILTSSNITDAAGNPLTGFNNLTFTTSFAEDNIPPSLVAINPVDGDTGIPINSMMDFQFSEPLDIVNVLRGIEVTENGNPVPGSIALSDGNRRVTFMPALGFVANALHNVVVNTNITDLAGNPLAAPVTTSFTAGPDVDLIRPTVLAVDPLNNSTGVGTNTVVRVEFSERVNPFTVTESTFIVVANSPFQLVDGTVDVATDGLSATFTPTTGLNPFILYRVSVNNVRDLANNVLQFGFNSFFTTGGGTDTSDPTVASTNLVDGVTEVAVNAPVVFRLSEAVSPQSVGQDAIVVTVGGVDVLGTVSLSADGLTLTFTPDALFATSTTFTVQVGGFTDSSGNAFASISSSFSTSASAIPDTTGPSVLSVNPANNSTNVAVTSNIVVTFNEQVDPITVNEFTVRITIDGFFGNLAGSFSVAGDVVTFTPLNSLPGSARVRVAISGFKDLVGNNGFSGPSTIFDTAATPDITPPAVVLITPSDGDVGVSLNADVVLTFSESLNPNTIGGNNFTLFIDGVERLRIVSRSSDNRTVTLSPFGSALPVGGLVTVVVTSGVEDLSGNALVPFQSQFTLSPDPVGPDFTRPKVVNQRPGNGAMNVSTDISVILFVDEPLDPTTVPGSLFVSENGALVSGTVTVSAGDQAIEFIPDVPFANDALVQVFLDSTATEPSGNAVTNFQGSFRTAVDTSTTAPVFEDFSPSGTGAPLNGVVEVQFNEPLDPATIDSSSVILRQSSGSLVIPSTVSLVRGGRVIRVVPDAPLVANTSYLLQVNTSVFDLDGSAVSLTSQIFITGDAEDIVNPVVVSVSPPEGFTDVGVNATIRVLFDERINALTVTGQTILVTDGTNPAIPCTISFSNNDQDVLIVPHALLADSTLYSLTIDGVEDLAGNPVTAQTTQFTTSSNLDLTSPVVVRKTPDNNAIDVPLNVVVQLELNEPVDPGTVNSNRFSVRDNTTFLNVPGTISLSPNGLSLSFAPDVPFAVGRTYTVSIFAKDLANNLFIVSSSFTTGFVEDTTAPQVVGVSPSDALSGVPTNALVVIEFDEPIQSLSIDGVTLSAGSVEQNIKRTLSNGNRTLTLLPLLLLDPLTAHTVTIDGILDLSGNPLVAPVITSFTTDAGVDLIAPTVIAVDPLNNTLGGITVGTNVVVRIDFSERVNPLTVTNSTFAINVNSGFQFIDGTVVVAADGLSATKTPTNPLNVNTLFRVTMNGVRDFANNNVGFNSFFRTGAGADTSNPAVASTNLVDGVTEVAVNAPVVFRLSEVVSAQSVGQGTIVVTTGGVDVPGTVSLSPDGLTLTFTPDAPFATSTTFLVQVGGFTDSSGNVFVPISSSFSTSASATPDTTGPSVLSVNPVNNSTDVDVTSNIVVTFNEPVDPITINENTVRITIDGFAGNLAGSLSVTGAVVTFTPLNPLPGSARVRTSISGFKDLVGNNGVSPSNNIFDTAATADTTPPAVVLVAPGDGDVGVSPNTDVVLTFSESLNANTINGNNIALFIDGAQRLSPVSRSSDNRTVTLSGFLPVGSLATVVVTSDVEDLSGNSIVPFQSQFTVSPDPVGSSFIRPRVVNQRPGNGAMNVSTDISVILFLDEPLDPVTVPGSLFVSENGVLVSGTATVSAGGQAIEFIPDVPFANDSLIQVFLDSTATDLSGNAVTNFQGSFRTAVNTSTTAPVFEGFSPSGSGVPLNVVFEVQFNESLDPATVNSGSVTLNAGTLVPSTVSLVRGGRVIRVVPDAPLVASTNHFLQVNSSVLDLDGDAVSAINRFITTGTAQDIVNPGVVSVSPPEGFTDVGVNATIRVLFDERINTLTVTGQTILVTDGTNPAIPCTISFSNNDQDVLIVPHSPLADLTLYSLTIDGVEDLAGNPATAQTTQFTTSSNLDLTRPTVVRRTPDSNSADVPVNAVVQLEFDEPIDPGTVNSSSFTVTDNTAFLNVPGTISLSSNGLSLSFAPDAPFAVDRTFSVNIFARDLANNFINVSSPFTTGSAEDTTAPQAARLSPSDALSGVPTNALVVIEFDEPIQSLSIDGVTLSAGSVEQNIKRTLSNGNRTLTLLPLLLLDPLTAHTVTIDGILDLSGNPLVAPVITSFTTDAGVDLTAPTVIAVDPLNNATGVARNTVVRVDFSERVNPLTVTNLAFRVTVNSGLQLIDGTVVVAADGLSATFTPTSVLDPNTLFGISVSGVKDLGNNSLSINFTSSFTTGPF